MVALVILRTFDVMNMSLNSNDDPENDFPQTNRLVAVIMMILFLLLIYCLR